jgi:molybdenum cofactor cytidylyltransferase
MKKISAIILAAGTSSRMGFLKQTANIKGKSLLELVLDKVRKFPFHEIIIVLGYKHEEVMKTLKLEYEKVVINEEYEKGMSSSLKKGVLNISKDSEAFAIFLADMPLIKEESIEKVINEFNERSCLIVAPIFNKVIGHPVIFHRNLIPEIINLEGDIGAKKVIEKYKDEACFIEIDDEGVLIDIDAPKDLEEVLKKLN